MKRSVSTTHAILIATVALLFGCTSTPNHTNVLIFGTNTKFAFDVSQDATGGLGFTLGFRRQEAVWMPLLPNQSPATGKTDLLPATCVKKTECPMFVGQDGTNLTDTYSVLASFGSKTGSGLDPQGKKAHVTGEIAQYFATGLAARELAKKGGAGLVNTNGDAALTAAEKIALEKDSEELDREVKQLLGFLTDPSGENKIDSSRLNTALSKSPGKEIPEELKTKIKAAKTIDELKTVLNLHTHDILAKPMLASLISQ